MSETAKLSVQWMVVVCVAERCVRPENGAGEEEERPVQPI